MKVRMGMVCIEEYDKWEGEFILVRLDTLDVLVAYVASTKIRSN